MGQYPEARSSGDLSLHLHEGSKAEAVPGAHKESKGGEVALDSVQQIPEDTGLNGH